jgi:hypothetical protein
MEKNIGGHDLQAAFFPVWSYSSLVLISSEKCFIFLEGTLVASIILFYAFWNPMAQIGNFFENK